MVIQSEQFVIRRFQRQTHPDDFAQAYAVREIVFIREQQVPPELEQDEEDHTCWHWLCVDSQTQSAVATGRVVSYPEHGNSKPVAKIGRVAVLKTHRGYGLGLSLMKSILADLPGLGFNETILDAQTHALGFYERLGFKAEGDEFMDADIPHYRMRLRLN